MRWRGVANASTTMRYCIDEVHRRRALQEAWNLEHELVPATIIKPVRDSLEALYEMDYAGVPSLVQEGLVADDPSGWSLDKLTAETERVRGEMLRAAGELRFEDATGFRDRLRELEAVLLER